MFNDVCQTKDGRWAGSYSNDYRNEYNQHTTVRPERAEFVEAVSYPTKVKAGNGKDYTFHYPEPCFRIEGDKVFAIYGNYAEELFTLKKEGVVTARQLFGNRKEENFKSWTSGYHTMKMI